MDHEVEQRIADLKAKLATRSQMKGYAKNCIAIEAEIARLETEGTLEPAPAKCTCSETLTNSGD